MIILGGASPVHEIGREAFQEVDQLSVMQPLCKYTHRPTTAARFPEIVSTAYRQTLSGRPGPVYIDCGGDVLEEEIEEAEAVQPSRAERRTRPAAEPGAVKESIEMLANAERPVIVAGGGVFFSGGASELERLVDITNIPFYTAPMSPRPGARGPCGLIAGRQGARQCARPTWCWWSGPVSTGCSSMACASPRDARLIQIDIEESEIAHNRSVDLGIVGDAKAVLGQLAAEAAAHESLFAGALESPWVVRLREQDERRAAQVAPQLNSDDVPIHPLRLCKEIRDFLDRDAILSVDGNEILHFGRQSIPTYLPGHRLNSGVTGTMGVGLPYGIGAKVAKPDKQVLVLHGDGSMGLNAMEVDTAVRYNLPVVTVVSNNAGWTARTPERRKPGRELGFTAFDEMGKALGAYGEKVEDPAEIRPALERAFDSGKPAVINVIVEPTAAGVSQAWRGARME